jgi:DUF438 domain-containing protein
MNMSRNWNQLLMDDHQAAEKVMAGFEKALEGEESPAPGLVSKVLDFFVGYVDQTHNQKEERHLFPLIEQRGIPRSGGPLAVMLAEHQRSRELLAEWRPLAEGYIGGDGSSLPALNDVFGKYASLLKEHYWKENDILYPMALRVMSEADNQAVVSGMAALDSERGAGVREAYYRFADDLAAASLEDLSFGLERGVLATILNTLPIEISFVDADDRVRYFSHEKGDKIFPRFRSAIGTAVENCHPEKSVEKVKQILADFKTGRRDVAEFWIDFQGKKVHVRYFPVKDDAGRYLGCLETVQDVTAIQKLTGERRLLDE